MKKLGSVLLVIMLLSSSLMATDIPKMSATRVKIEDIMGTINYVQSSDILGGIGQYFHARSLASLLGYYTYFNNNTLRFESIKPDVNPMIIEFDLKNNTGHVYNKNEFIEGTAVSNLPSYKRLSHMPLKVQGSYFIHMEEFCESLGLKSQFIMSFVKGTYYEIETENIVIMTDIEDKVIKQQVDKLMNDELLDCRCTQAGLSEHIADSKYLETGKGMNSLACYLITEKYGATTLLPKVKNVTGAYKGNNKNRLIYHIKENKNTEGMILQIKDENGIVKRMLNKYALDIDRSLDRAVRFSSQHQMGTLSGNFSIDSTIDDYNRFVDLYNRVYSKSEVQLSRIKV